MVAEKTHFPPLIISVQFSSVQSLSPVRLFATPWTAAHQPDHIIIILLIIVLLMVIWGRDFQVTSLISLSSWKTFKHNTSTEFWKFYYHILKAQICICYISHHLDRVPIFCNYIGSSSLSVIVLHAGYYLWTDHTWAQTHFSCPCLYYFLILSMSVPYFLMISVPYIILLIALLKYYMKFWSFNLPFSSWKWLHCFSDYKSNTYTSYKNKQYGSRLLVLKKFMEGINDII